MTPKKQFVTIVVILLKHHSYVGGEICTNIQCSNIIDEVCSISERNSIKVIRKFQNICYLHKLKCKLKTIAHVYQVEDGLCGIKKHTHTYLDPGRRMTDFSIVGAHQACNHTCPTYCVDTYEPACAQIWTTPNSFKYRPMINHCHIDLLSCAAGVNVTVEPLGKCYKNPSGLMFMSQIAAMKSLKLLDDAPPPPQANHYVTKIASSHLRKNRRSKTGRN